jgi:hypothetical protein
MVGNITGGLPKPRTDQFSYMFDSSGECYLPEYYIVIVLVILYRVLYRVLLTIRSTSYTTRVLDPVPALLVLNFVDFPLCWISDARSNYPINHPIN